MKSHDSWEIPLESEDFAGRKRVGRERWPQQQCPAPLDDLPHNIGLEQGF